MTTPIGLPPGGLTRPQSALLQAPSAEVALSQLGPTQLDPAQVAGLSAAGLLDYATTSTGILDGQIATAMEQMQGDLASSNVLSADREKLDGVTSFLLTLSSDTNKKSEVGRADLERLGVLPYAELFGLDPSAQSWDLSPAMVDKATAQLEQQQSRVNSQQERKMLMLQEAMRQRSQVTQLVSNILRERGETMSQLVRNLA